MKSETQPSAHPSDFVPIDLETLPESGSQFSDDGFQKAPAKRSKRDKTSRGESK